ncbi:GntR family transcriptional regulator [Acidaminobacter hydrogenoformans]|uniref:DNA-binding transcriptional regulator, GntR family n=1 Tax=Acidaminobacter hydrogenoformans DSM 2784 TaxID=1120920 RepID=A0A1G5RZG4_9FIRM|nr:GntR family transcriptional regulator [Acidaminobacter hydrogenoformans]SCZ79248.1 DNA-binding transcriptional regulator, GntR family [Acidaminobacter hydrogenoformans DSM 2784]
MDIFDQKKENRSLTTIIFDRVRDDILSGKYVTGEKIVEAKLADELGVSRTPVREALKQLELDGLVENLPNRGVIVKGITDQDIGDIYTIRLAIEAIAAKWSVHRMEKAELDQLREIFELMEFYAAKQDVDKFFELNTIFHETIYHATKSRYLEHLLKDFQLFIKSTRNASLRVEGRMDKALAEHRTILEAFISRDEERAVESITKHISNSRANVDRTRNITLDQR